MARNRDNIVMRKVDAPKKVTLPNGRTFYAKYKRLRINLLPNNVRIKRRYRSRGRRNGRRQQGWGIKDILKKVFNLAKRAAKSKVGNFLAKMVIENVPTFY